MTPKFFTKLWTDLWYEPMPKTCVTSFHIVPEPHGKYGINENYYRYSKSLGFYEVSESVSTYDTYELAAADLLHLRQKAIA